jgi:predicted transcriptional regulator
MAQMIRKQVTLSARSGMALKRLARKTGRKESEILRQTIEQQLELAQTTSAPCDPAAWQEARAFIESLIAQGPVSGGRTWTREELYEGR